VGPQKKDVIVDVAPIIVHGRLRGSVGVIHDVSQIKELTEELAQAKQRIRHLEAKYTFEDIIGDSQSLKQLLTKQNGQQTFRPRFYCVVKAAPERSFLLMLSTTLVAGDEVSLCALIVRPLLNRY